MVDSVSNGLDGFLRGYRAAVERFTTQKNTKLSSIDSCQQCLKAIKELVGKENDEGYNRETMRARNVYFNGDLLCNMGEAHVCEVECRRNLRSLQTSFDGRLRVVDRMYMLYEIAQIYHKAASKFEQAYKVYLQEGVDDQEHTQVTRKSWGNVVLYALDYAVLVADQLLEISRLSSEEKELLKDCVRKASCWYIHSQEVFWDATNESTSPTAFDNHTYVDGIRNLLGQCLRLSSDLSEGEKLEIEKNIQELPTQNTLATTSR